MTIQPRTYKRSFAIIANQIAYSLSRHWLLVFCLTWGVFIGLPFLAPVFMKFGWTGAARIIYLFYALECHQLPQRSFFLFGPKLMYSLPEIQAAWQPTNNPLILRQFIGNAEMGWKVAWCERTTFMYTAILCVGLFYGFLRKQLRPLPSWVFILLILPVALDGGTHFISDVISGFNNGFRDTNLWLAVLTAYKFPATFYAGDTLFSFNSWARFITGILSGVGLGWFVFPYLEDMFTNVSDKMETKFYKAGLEL